MGINPYGKWGGTNQANAGSSAYPYGSAKNIPFLGSTEGTPFVADFANDIWGFFQKLLDQGSITPSGNPDSVLASDYYDGMRAAAGFPGMIVPLALNDTPANYGLRILLMDGSGILAANYSELVTNTYVGDPANATADAFFKADDAAGTSRNTAGIYFILPDARGQFIRGIDSTGVEDPDGGARLPGDLQNWAFYTHYHTVRTTVDASTYGGVTFDASILIPGANKMVIDTQATDILQAQTPTKTTGASIPANLQSIEEVRPQNISFDLGIWY